MRIKEGKEVIFKLSRIRPEQHEGLQKKNYNVRTSLNMAMHITMKGFEGRNMNPKKRHMAIE